MLENIRIVLVQTSHPGNIGAAARAMKTMGLNELILVKPKIFPAAEASAMASGAEDILEKAVVFESLSEALSGAELIFGTSARERYLNWPLCVPKHAARIMAQEADKKIAIVFGRERTGLTNEELQLCHYHITIPANPVYSSLNLAAAVQLISYEVYEKSLENQPKGESDQDVLAPHEELERLYHHLEETLVDIKFLNPKAPKFLMWRLRRLFQRARLEQQEVNILRGICKAAQQRRKNHA